MAQDVRSGLALAMDCCQYGDRNDVPLVPDVVHQVRSMGQSPGLWMGDRQFCDLNLIGLLKDLLATQWQARWLKTPTNIRYTTGRTLRVEGGSTSVFKVLEQHRSERQRRRSRGRQRH